MADTAVAGPANDPYGYGVPIKSKSYTGAGSGWAGGNDLAVSPPVRGVRCGTGGNLHVRFLDGTTDTIPNVLDGETVQGVFAAIYADSTVQNITLLW